MTIEYQLGFFQNLPDPYAEVTPTGSNGSLSIKTINRSYTVLVSIPEVVEEYEVCQY